MDCKLSWVEKSQIVGVQTSLRKLSFGKWRSTSHSSCGNYNNAEKMGKNNNVIKVYKLYQFLVFSNPTTVLTSQWERVHVWRKGNWYKISNFSPWSTCPVKPETTFNFLWKTQLSLPSKQLYVLHVPTCKHICKVLSSVKSTNIFVCKRNLTESGKKKKIQVQGARCKAHQSWRFINMHIHVYCTCSTHSRLGQSQNGHVNDVCRVSFYD